MSRRTRSLQSMRGRLGVAVAGVTLSLLLDGSTGRGQATVDLSVSLSGPSSATVNIPFSYTISVSSVGTSTGTTVTDVLPPYVQFVSSSLGSACQANSGANDPSVTVVCTVSAVPSNFTITVNPTVAGSIVNVVGVIGSGFDGNMSNNSASLSTSVTGGSSGGATTNAGFFWSDFDGDGFADKVIYRPGSSSTWYVKKSNGAADLVTSFGTTGDIPVPGRYTGGVPADFAVFRPSTGFWYVLAVGGASQSAQWGASGDIPVPGQYGGDSRTDYAVWRPSDKKWYVKTAEGTQLPSVQWGATGDIPVPGDYDGDGITDMTVFRPSNGTWYVKRSSGGTATVAFGASGDIPVVAAFTNTTGRADYGIFRPSNGTWYIRTSLTPPTDSSVVWGTSGDAPLPANMVVDARADKVVWRPSNGTWYVLSAEGVSQPAVIWGISGDTAIAR